MASDITGKRMYLLKDKILYKHPGKKGIDPHTDDLFLPLPSWTGMLAIDRCHAENGHLQLLLPKDPTADAVDSMIRQNMGLDPRDVKYEIAQLEHKEWAWKGIDLEAGDIVWFPGRLFHRALDNVSSSPRTVILLNYTSDPNFSYHDYFHHPHYRTI
jgi:ectoine hydroxylase-related dioxygenase (phytanoyl-CoA dioxygenase family)